LHGKPKRDYFYKTLEKKLLKMSIKVLNGDTMQTLTAEELKQKLDENEDIILVNVLDAGFFEQKHIPGSISLPVDEIDTKAVTALPDKDAEIIVYCASTECQASTKAYNKLVMMGYTNVADFTSGLTGWEKAGFTFEGTDV
jgi:rhodanese-related sulfurtransferase